MLALLPFLALLVLPAQSPEQATPVVEALHGRVLLVDARHGAKPCAQKETLRAEAQGALELGAGAAARWSLAQRTAVHWEGATSCEWSANGLTVLAVDRMRWDWRQGGEMLRLPAGWSVCGGPGVYELQSDACSSTLRTLAGAPLQLLEGSQPRATVPAGESTKIATPREWRSMPAKASSVQAWSTHEWPWTQQDTVETQEAQVPQETVAVDVWSPATLACAAPRFAPLRVSTVQRQVRLTAADTETSASATVAQWPSWLLEPLNAMFDRLRAQWQAWSAWAARLQAMQAYGVRFDLWAPFEVRFEAGRLRLLLDANAERAYAVRGLSWLIMQPGAAVVLERGGRLASHAGDVAVRPLQ